MFGMNWQKKLSGIETGHKKPGVAADRPQADEPCIDRASRNRSSAKRARVPTLFLIVVMAAPISVFALQREAARDRRASLGEGGGKVQTGPPTGACCVDGVCQMNIPQDECETDQCGMWLGEGSNCDSNCPFTLIGVCCTGDQCSEDMGEDSCDCAGGTWNTDSDSCQDVICGEPLGRCCLPGDCQNNYTQQQCLDECGMWAQGQSCGATPCLLTQGACCVGTNCVNAGTPSACTCLGGTWHGGETCLLGGQNNDCKQQRHHRFLRGR